MPSTIFSLAKMDTINSDMIRHVALYLSHKDLYSFILTCRFHYRSCSEENQLFWRKRVENIFCPPEEEVCLDIIRAKPSMITFYQQCKDLKRFDDIYHNYSTIDSSYNTTFKENRLDVVMVLYKTYGRLPKTSDMNRATGYDCLNILKWLYVTITKAIIETPEKAQDPFFLLCKNSFTFEMCAGAIIYGRADILEWLFELGIVLPEFNEVSYTFYEEDDKYDGKRLIRVLPGFKYDAKSLIYCVSDLCAMNTKNPAEVLHILEKRGFHVDEWVANSSMHSGNIMLLDYLETRRILPNEDGCVMSCGNNKLEALKWAAKRGIFPSNVGSTEAAGEGNIEILKWIVEEGIDKPSDILANWAASHGHIHILDWLEPMGYLPRRPNSAFKKHPGVIRMDNKS